MREGLTIPLFLLFLSLTGAFASCQTLSGGTALTIDTFDKQLQVTPNAQLLDVRTADEYKTGHLKGAVNIDWNSDDFLAQVQKLDKTKPVFVYCLSGVRSGKAAAKLTELGFKQVYKMDGGIKAWNAAGKPVEK